MIYVVLARQGFNWIVQMVSADVEYANALAFAYSDLGEWAKVVTYAHTDKVGYEIATMIC
jgi:hypothetical protein